MPEEDLFEAIGGDKKPGSSAFQSALKEEEVFVGLGTCVEDEKSENVQYLTLYKRGLWIAHLHDLRQLREPKEQFSKYVLKYLAIFSFCVLFIILCQAINPKFDLWCGKKGYTLFRFRLGGFHLDNSVLVSLVGGTSASAIGLVAIVLQGLFKVPKEEKPEEKPKSEDKKSS